MKRPQNLPQPPTFTTSHHKQPPPLENEEECATLSNILKKILLELKKLWRCREKLRRCMKSLPLSGLHLENPEAHIG